uniref:Uncharacterized protein n=1 Tax=Zea mays TaxID=4577 RepID=C4J2B6_MAIZE|nr:unknown [Zea mays]
MHDQTGKPLKRVASLDVSTAGPACFRAGGHGYPCMLCSATSNSIDLQQNVWPGGAKKPDLKE